MKKRILFLLLCLLLLTALCVTAAAAYEEGGEPSETTEATPEPTETPTPTPSKKDELYLHFLEEKDEATEKASGILNKIQSWLNVREEDLDKLPGWIKTGYTTFLVCGACMIPLSVIFGIFLMKAHKDNRKWVKRGKYGFCVLVPLVITFLLIAMPSLYLFFNRGL